MKKILIMTGIALMAILSCSKDDVKEVNRGKAIDFRAATQTKGETIYGTGTLGSFYATAFEGGNRYFSDVVFSQVGEYFSSNTVYYWPAEETSLDFVTYSPSISDLGGEDAVLERNETQTTTEGETVTAVSYKIKNITPKDDVYEQFDFVTALATGQKEAETENGIPLIFYHNMTGISFRAMENVDNYEYIVAGVRIDNAVPSGDYDLTSGEWTLGTGRKSYEKTFVDNTITLDNNSQSLYGTYPYKYGGNEEHYAFIIPQPFDDGTEAGTTALPTFSVYLQVNFIQGDGENKTKTKVFPTGEDYGWVQGYFPGISTPSNGSNGETTLVYKWEKGVKYNYVISFTDPSTVLGDAVKMTTVSVNEWIDASSNTFANQAMIGVWNAIGYYEEVIRSKTIYDEQEQKWVPVKDNDGNYVLETEIIDETTESSVIANEVGGFNYVVIDDGTALRIKGANDELFPTPYVLENDYLLIDNFKYNGQYEVRPHIDQINPVVGENKGSAIISVLQEESGTKEEGNYKRRTQYITYEILPITSLNE